MIEAHTGSRPGNPQRLLLAMALTLVLTLGAAWLQVRSARVLGSHQPLLGTPLHVRVPQDWRPIPGDAGGFASIYAINESEGVPARRVHFMYERYGSFRPAQELVQLPERRAPGERVQADLVPGTIGGFPGIELRTRSERVIRNTKLVTESIERVVSLPRGEVIRVIYVPLMEITNGDLDLLDEICAAVRVDDAAYARSSEEWFRAAGLVAPPLHDVKVSGPDFETVQGVNLLGTAEKLPFCVSLLRTWLAPGRTPEALLADFAEKEWLLAGVPPIASQSRPDGAEWHTMLRPETDGLMAGSRSLRLVTRADQALLIATYAADDQRPAAENLADQLARTVDFAEARQLDVTAALSATSALIPRVLQTALEARTRQQAERNYLVGELNEAPVAIVSEFAVSPRGGGYAGGRLLDFDDGTAREMDTWTADPGLRTYRYQFEALYPLPSGATTISVDEQRGKESGLVQRTISVNEGEPRVLNVRVGQSFVPPPLETLYDAYVARQQGGFFAYEASDGFGSDTHTVLLRPLLADPAGRWRVLRQADYWPRGSIVVVNDDGRVHQEIFPGGRVEAKSRAEAERVAPALRAFERRRR